MNTVNGKVYNSVYELLENPERWTKRTWARNENDCMVSHKSEHATKFCLLGAIHRIYVDREKISEVEIKVKRICLEKYDHEAIGQTNDLLTHEQVLEIVKKAGI